jgi:tetratricopeptide (TPR) repeat protein
MKIKLTVASCLVFTSLGSPLFAQTYGGLPVAGLGDKPQTETIQPVGFWDRIFHWRRHDDESSKENSRRLDDWTRRIHPNGSLTAAIVPGGSPKRAAALRFGEKARRLLLAGAYQRALIYFEKALGLDANPYFYYYLARAHYHLAHTDESLRFLDVAESFLGDQSDWMTEVETLRAKFEAVRQPTGRNVHPVALPVR